MNGKIYISGALTGIANPESVKANYECLGLLCERLGLEAFVPHKHTDPIAHPNVLPKDVYANDRYHVSTSGLVIAHAGNPSLGTGQEIEIARECSVPVILLCERSKPLSRMTQGSPNILTVIRYDDYGEAMGHVKAILSDDFESIASSFGNWRGR